MHQDAVALTRKSWPTLGQRCEFSFGITWNNDTVDGSRHPARGHQLRESSEYPIIYRLFLYIQTVVGIGISSTSFFWLHGWKIYPIYGTCVGQLGNPRHWPQFKTELLISCLCNGYELRSDNLAPGVCHHFSRKTKRSWI